MKIYFAGTPGISERESKWLKFIDKRLLSFWDLWKQQFGVPASFKMITNIKKEKENYVIKSNKNF